MDHLVEDEPPFALSDDNSPQHMFVDSPVVSLSASTSQQVTSPREVSKLPTSMTIKQPKASGSQISQSSCPPGLTESVMTDTSSLTACDSEILGQGSVLPYLDTSSTFLLSSLPTISHSIGASSYLPNSHLLEQSQQQPSAEARSDFVNSSHASATFSQLLRAAGDDDVVLGQSRMPIVPENESLEESCAPPGALISSPTHTGALSNTLRGLQNNGNNNNTQWLTTLLGLAETPSTGLSEPLLNSSLPCEPLLAPSPSEAALERAKTSVKSLLEDDQSFEVSMEMTDSCTVQSVMNILGNPELLRMWCDPIQSLVVTSSSDGSRDSSAPREDGREYEGEWIEATTTALESPPSGVGHIVSAGQVVLDFLGFAAYGRITMFVERRRGQVGLTVGPFSGGIHASHTIKVYQEGNHVRIVDRVRLNQETDGTSISSLFFCGVLDSCLSSCLLPSLKGYMDQVSTSMARLRILVESGELSQESEIVSAS